MQWWARVAWLQVQYLKEKFGQEFQRDAFAAGFKVLQ
jgi:hypothetical protein